MTEQTKNIVILPSEDERSRWCARLMNNTERPFVERVSELNNTDFVIDPNKYQEILDQQHSDACDEVISLRHPARKKYGDLSVVLSKVSTVQQMVAAIKKAGSKYSHDILPDDQEKQNKLYNSYVGDVFEVFVEFLIKSNSHNRQIGIVGYRPVNVSNGGEDYGVDGYGIGVNGRPATVQIKFRGEMMKYTLTANEDHLTNFKNNSHEAYGVNFDDVDNMLIVSTAGKIHHKTRDKMLNGKVRCLLLDEIEHLSHGVTFWNDFRRLLSK